MIKASLNFDIEEIKRQVLDEAAIKIRDKLRSNNIFNVTVDVVHNKGDESFELSGPDEDVAKAVRFLETEDL